jgi:uncharacterized protein YcnI
MAHPLKTLARALTAILTTALFSVVCMLTLAPAASARVTIVPGSVKGGETQSFAVRLSNERTGVSTTRLELTFPADVQIPRVKVAKIKGWTATVATRRLDPPVTVAGEEFDEVVDSIVLEGGEVAPKQFEQFIVTAGPLPQTGRLVFAATQGYSDGSEDRWTDPTASGKEAAAPTITLTAGGTSSASSSGGTAATLAADAPGAETEGRSVLPWALLAIGLVGAGSALFFWNWPPGRRAIKAIPTTAGSATKRVLEKVGSR